MIGGRQTIWIRNWPWKFIIAHEIGHALGLIHEHQRPDRGRFVKINDDNIESGEEKNFRIMAADLYTPYDFRSIMHYGRNYFSNGNGTTIDPLPDYINEGQYMGNVAYLSARDGHGMARRYGPPGDQYCAGKPHPGPFPGCLYKCTCYGWSICGCPPYPQCP